MEPRPAFVCGCATSLSSTFTTSATRRPLSRASKRPTFRPRPRISATAADTQPPSPSPSFGNDDGDNVSAFSETVDEDGAFVLEEDSDEDSTFVLEDEDDIALSSGLVARPVRSGAVSSSDFILVGAILAVVYAFAATTRRLVFSSTPYTAIVVSTSLSVLPGYALMSLTRMFVGYVVSLVFSLAYAYFAYRVKFAAQAMMLAIDVLQSIPLFSFLPAIVLGLISLFPPGARIGVELAAVLLLFTSMAWNMLLGFYQSLTGIPHDLHDAAASFRLSPFKRFFVLELPAGAITLVWNSLISVAGGWFCLMSIESFELGHRDFRLPGLGSFLAAAANAGDYRAIAAALAVIIGIIIVIDICVWRPLIAWSAKFRYGGGAAPTGDKSNSFIFNLFSRSLFVRSLVQRFVRPAWDAFVDFRIPHLPRRKQAHSASAATSAASASAPPASAGFLRKATGAISATTPLLVKLAFYAAVAVGSLRALDVVRIITLPQWRTLLTGAACTVGRVCAALVISLLWTVPVGIAIGRNPKLAERLQPVLQVAASVPATAVFPLFLAFLAQLGGGLQIGSIALMTLGTMWYVLVNVIAGTQAIPAEFFDVDAVYGRGWMWRWRTLILPGIFPYLVTGLVAAVGGAWNASIVSEYVVFRGGVLQTHGLGALISSAAASGDYPVLLAATLVMSVLVLLTNKFVWGPLQRLSETKYRI